MDTHLVCVVAMCVEILSELGIFLLNRVLVDVGEEEESNEASEYCDGTCDPEWSLTPYNLESVSVWACAILNRGCAVRADVSSDFADSSGKPIVFSSAMND